MQLLVILLSKGAGTVTLPIEGCESIVARAAALDALAFSSKWRSDHVEASAELITYQVLAFKIIYTIKLIMLSSFRPSYWLCNSNLKKKKM